MTTSINPAFLIEGAAVIMGRFDLHLASDFRDGRDD